MIRCLPEMTLLFPRKVDRAWDRKTDRVKASNVMQCNGFKWLTYNKDLKLQNKYVELGLKTIEKSKRSVESKSGLKDQE